MNHQELLNLFCSVQRALLDKITPNLRAIYIKIKNSNSFELIFYYDHTLSEEEEELVSLIDTEIMADFPPPDYENSYYIKVISYPNKIFQEGYCLYKIYEN